jgi:hypothetical protein
MGIGSALNKLERRYAWSFIGFVLAAIFGAVTIYIEFVRDNRPNLRFEIVSDTSVLDVREPLGDLQIIYSGVDIQKSRQALRVMVVRVHNAGLEDILRGHYDERSPFGFVVQDGSLLRVELLTASNPYLQANVGAKPLDATSAVFNPVIIESQESFTFKCLILHSDSLAPSVRPLGKIAGVRQITVDVPAVDTQPSFLSRAFAGTIFVQLARLGGYLFAFLLLGASIAIGSETISSAVTRRRRRRDVLGYKAVTTRRLSQRDEFIFDWHLKHGLGPLRSLALLAESPSRLNRRMVRFEELRTKASEASDRKDENIDSEGEMLHPMVDIRMEDMMEAAMRESARARHLLFSAGVDIPRLKKEGIIRQESGQWIFDAHVRETLREFLIATDPKGARKVYDPEAAKLKQPQRTED